jgi:hypothetical protein
MNGNGNVVVMQDGNVGVGANEANRLVIPIWKVHLDARANGRDDPRCYWEVYEMDEMGGRLRQRTVAAFRTFEAAARYMGRSGYYALAQVRVFDTVEEVRAEEREDRRRAALAKLSREDREVLGLGQA